jgi:hypothetical protein
MWTALKEEIAVNFFALQNASHSMHDVQDMDLNSACQAFGGRAGMKGAIREWKQRHETLAAAEASGTLPKGASRNEVNQFCERNKMQCRMAEGTLNDLGVVSEAFGDALAEFVSKDKSGNRDDFQTTMLLRYGACSYTFMHVLAFTWPHLVFAFPEG